MTQTEIDKIAREYAEEATKADAGDPNLSASDLNGIKRDVAEYAEEVIRFLLRRYCLVEKCKAESTYNRIWNEWNFSLDAENKANSKFILSAIESLFPEIAKEVES